MRTYNNNYMDVKDDVFFLIKHLSKCIELALDKEANKLGLTPQQARLLGFLMRRKSENIKVRQIDIEERFQLSKSTVSGLVKRMEAKNLIIKEKKDKDIWILPSEEGIKTAEEFKEKAHIIRNEVSKDLSDEEKELVKNALMKLLRNLEKEGD